LALISAIIVSPDGWPSIRRLVAHLHAQTVREEIELIFVFPASAGSDLHDRSLPDFAAARVVLIENMESTSRARAAGVRKATAPIVVMTEDHSFPEPEWAEALIRAHQADWAVVGPAVKNGNPDSLLSWSNLVIEYNEWLDPAPGGEVSHVPGHNSAYKRDVLLSYNDDLEAWLEAESVLHWDLQSSGYKLAIEPAACTRHFNFSQFFPSLELRYHCGRQFAAVCRAQWTLARRLLYIAATPLIPFVRLTRIVRQLRYPGRPAHLIPRLVPVCLILLTVEAIGACAGYIFGLGSSSLYIARIDFHRENFMNSQDRKRFAE
jgi:hypothetical protein